MSSFTLGRYIPIDSAIHRMDPRAKIMAMLVLLVCIFIPAGWRGYGVMFMVTCSAILVAKLSFKFIWKSMKPMLFMLVFLFVINIFSIHSGDIWLKVFGNSLTGCFSNFIYCSSAIIDDYDYHLFDSDD